MKISNSVRAAIYGSRTTTRGPNIRTQALDDAAGNVLVFRGYASITDQPYLIADWLGEYEETISCGAFAKSLQEQDDVRLLVNHEGLPLARTKSGTLSLREIVDVADDPLGNCNTGLWVEANLDPANPKVLEIKSAMARGDLSEMSFAFQATRQSWSKDASTRTVTEVRLVDVSIVTYPANPATSATLSERDGTSASILAIVDSSPMFDASQRQVIREALDARAALVKINVNIGADVVEPDEDDDPDEDDVVQPYEPGSYAPLVGPGGVPEPYTDPDSDTDTGDGDSQGEDNQGDGDDEQSVARSSLAEALLESARLDSNWPSTGGR